MGDRMKMKSDKVEDACCPFCSNRPERIYAPLPPRMDFDTTPVTPPAEVAPQVYVRCVLAGRTQANPHMDTCQNTAYYTPEAWNKRPLEKKLEYWYQQQIYDVKPTLSIVDGGVRVLRELPEHPRSVSFDTEVWIKFFTWGRKAWYRRSRPD